MKRFLNKLMQNQKTLEFRIAKPSELFRLNPPKTIDGCWMIGLTSLDVSNSIFKIKEEKNKFEHYTDTFDEISFEDLKDELEEILKNPNFTPFLLEDEKIGPRIVQAYKKLRSEKSSTVGYILLVMGSARSTFRNFESFLSIVVGLDQDGVQIIIKQYNSNFVTFEIPPGIYSIKELSEVVHTMGDHDGSLGVEFDDDSMKTKFILKCLVELSER